MENLISIRNQTDGQSPPIAEESARTGRESLYRDMVVIVWRRKWSVLFLALLCVSAAAFYLSRAQEVYGSSARIHISRQGPRIFHDFDALVGGQQESYLHVQAEILSSRSALRRAVADPVVQALPEVAADPAAWTADRLKGMLSVKVGRSDDTLTVTCESDRPEVACVIVNAVARAYLAEQAQNLRKTTTDAIDTLQRLREDRKKELTTAMTELARVRKANYAIAFGDDPKENNVLQRLSTLSSELTRAEVATIEARALYEAAKPLGSDPYKLQRLIEAHPESGALLNYNLEAAMIRRQIREQEQRLAELSPALGTKHAEVRTLQASIEKLREDLGAVERQSTSGMLDVITQQYQRAQNTEAELRKAFVSQQKEAVELNSKRAEFMLLDMTVKRLGDLVEKVERRIEELSLEVDTTAPVAKMLEEGTRGTSPVRPQRFRIMASAMALGLALGVGCAFLQNWADQRLHSASDMAPVLKHFVLGAIPHVSRRWASRWLVAKGEGPVQAAEAFRILGTSVRLKTGDTSRRLVLVTSPESGEGKSFVCGNLAAVMGEVGQRTLVIDADVRCGVQHAVFGVASGPGLANVLAGEVPLSSAIQLTAFGNVSVLTAGTEAPGSLELLHSKQFRALLDEAASRFDYIIIDSPPLTAAAETLVLTAVADLTLLVLRMHRTTRAGIAAASHMLEIAGKANVGAIINDMATGLPPGYEATHGRHLRALRPRLESREGKGVRSRGVADSARE